MPPGGVPGAPRKRPGGWATPPFLLCQQRTRPRPSCPRSLQPGGVAWRGVACGRGCVRPVPLSGSRRPPGSDSFLLPTAGPSRTPSSRPLVPGSPRLKCDLHLKPAPRFAPSWGSRGCAVGTQLPARRAVLDGAVTTSSSGVRAGGAAGEEGGRAAGHRGWSPGVAEATGQEQAGSFAGHPGAGARSPPFQG